MNNPRVYLSGGFKSQWQKRLIAELGNCFTFYNPLEHGLEASPSLYTPWDLHYVRQCDVLFAYMEASNPSGYGLALEVGVAFGLNKTIILIDERSTVDAQFSKHFGIVHATSSVVFPSLEEGIKYLKTFTQA